MSKNRFIENRSVSHAPEPIATRFEFLAFEGTRGRYDADIVSGIQRWRLDSRGLRLTWHLDEELSAADELGGTSQEHLLFPAHGLRASGSVHPNRRLRFLGKDRGHCGSA